MEKDDELERMKRKKLREMLREREEKEKPILRSRLN